MTSPGGNVPAPNDEDPLVRLRKIVHLLRAPGGCPWDREQTHASLVTNLLEEAYEVADAIRSGDDSDLCEELGDLLLQVIMHAEIASEDQRFNLEAIASGISDKLVRRHPHVFATSDATDTESVLKQWDEIKRQEKGEGAEVPLLQGTGKGLPALIQATKLQKKAAKVGFDWASSDQIIEKIKEELIEVEEALAGDDEEHLREEMGDLLFAVVNLVRKKGWDSEELLLAANAKFRTRFGFIEKTLRQEGETLDNASFERMDALWNQSKAE